jgi:uncharacterized protein (DUF1697 family)
MNVGTTSRIAMVQFSTALEDAGFLAPTTYMQSGNVIVRHVDDDASVVANEAASAVATRLGFPTTVIALDSVGLAEALMALGRLADDPIDAHLHVSFLASDPAPFAQEALQRLCLPNERIAIIGRLVLLYAPDGVGRSKVAAAIERATGVSATARNRRTLRALASMLADLEGRTASLAGTP